MTHGETQLEALIAEAQSAERGVTPEAAERFDHLLRNSQLDALRSFGFSIAPPRREVTEEAGVWRVGHSEFETTDRALADAVAAELDRIDPLPRT